MKETKCFNFRSNENIYGSYLEYIKYCIIFIFIIYAFFLLSKMEAELQGKGEEKGKKKGKKSGKKKDKKKDKKDKKGKKGKKGKGGDDEVSY